MCINVYSSSKFPVHITLCNVSVENVMSKIYHIYCVQYIHVAVYIIYSKEKKFQV